MNWQKWVEDLLHDKPTHSNHTHCQVAQKANSTSQNLSKSIFAPTLKNEINKIKTAYNNVYSAYHPAGCYDTIHGTLVTINPSLKKL
jgi:hypothetical protein